MNASASNMTERLRHWLLWGVLSVVIAPGCSAKLISQSDVPTIQLIAERQSVQNSSRPGRDWSQAEGRSHLKGQERRSPHIATVSHRSRPFEDEDVFDDLDELEEPPWSKDDEPRKRRIATQTRFDEPDEPPFSREDSRSSPKSKLRTNFKSPSSNPRLGIARVPSDTADRDLGNHFRNPLPRDSARRKSANVGVAYQADDIRRFGLRPADETAHTDADLPETEEAPAPPQRIELPRRVHIPLEGDEAFKDINLTEKNGRVSLVARNVPVQSVLNLLAQQQGLNLITGDDVDTNISVTLNDVSFTDALSSIVAIAGCTWTEQKGIVLVTKISADSGSPEVTGKVVQVFPLNYISAADVEGTVKGLLSPLGQLFISQMSATDRRRTQEQLVVEDLPSSLTRIAELIAQLDQPPRQVMIQAHVLQVELKDDTRHGINWERIIKTSGGTLSLKTAGFANPLASPASFLSFDGDKLDALVELLKTTNDAKTLASPKIIVANGQEARIQIGQRLGYFVTTTTQTSTLQNVNFLDTGVVMRVTPQISQDNRVLMAVRPEVSSGKISSLGLPETQTTEANTTVLVDNGGGMVIGGLIKETDNETQDKVPILGDIWFVGRAFQRRSIARSRSEIVIVLIPRIAPYQSDYCEVEQSELARAQTRLFHGALQREPRPWEPKLPDAVANPRRLRFHRLGALFTNPWHSNPAPLRHYFPTADEECFEDCEPHEIEYIESPSAENYVPTDQPLRNSDARRFLDPSATSRQ